MTNKIVKILSYRVSKTALVGVFIAFTMFGTTTIQAVSVQDLQAQIKSLLQMISQLQQQLIQTNGGVTPVITPPIPVTGQCENLTYNLYLGKRDGNTGGEVSKLQRFLTRTGDYTYRRATGYYGPSTIRAVQAWQRANGVVRSGTPDSTGYGVVGPSTRKAMRCGTTELQNVIIVATPKIAKLSSKRAIFDFVVKNYISDKNIDEDVYFGDGTKSALGYTNSLNARHDYHNAGTYLVRFVRNGITLASTSVTVLPDWCEDGNCDTNKPPTIHSFSGPTTLKVGEKGTWSVSASDPENGQLSYSIQWGDERVYASTQAQARRANNEFAQNTSFQHTYSQPGRYTVRITVRDDAGNKVETTSTVKVIDKNIKQVMVTYSDTVKSFAFGQRIDIKWSIDGFVNNQHTQAKLTLHRVDNGKPVDSGVVAKVNAFSNGYLYPLPDKSDYLCKSGMKTFHCYESIKKALESGNDSFYLEIEIVEDDVLTGIKNRTNSFKIFDSTEVVPIKVTAPNGGEEWTIGEKLNSVTWSPYAYHPKKINPPTDVTASLEQKVGNSFRTLGRIIEQGKASIHWRGAIDRWDNLAPEGSNYYVRVKNNKTGEEDRSDAPFTLKWAPTKIQKVSVSKNWHTGTTAYKQSTYIHTQFTVPQRVQDYSVALYKNDKWFKWIKQNVQLETKSGNPKDNQRFSFVPSNVLTKEEAMQGGDKFKIYVTARLKDGGYVDKKSDSFGLDVVGDVNNGVAISSVAQPRNSLAPQRAKNVKFTRFALTAGDKDVALPGGWITVKVAPDDSVIKKVSLYKITNGRRFHDSVVVAGDNKAIFGEYINIPAHSTVEFELTGDMGIELGKYNGDLASISVLSIDSNHISTAHSLPITGARHTINTTLNLCNANGTVSSGITGYEADCSGMSNHRGITRGYMNGRLFITTKNELRNNAVDICKNNHKVNPTKTLRCTWNGVEVYNKGPLDTMSCHNYSVRLCPSNKCQVRKTGDTNWIRLKCMPRDGETSKRGITRGYMNGRLFLTTKNQQKSYAVDICKKNHQANPTKTLRCTWNGVEVYNKGATIQKAGTFSATGQNVRPIWEKIKFKTHNNKRYCYGAQYIAQSPKYPGAWLGAESCDDTKNTKYKLYMSNSKNGTYYQIADTGGHGQDHCELVNPDFKIANDGSIKSGGCTDCAVGSMIDVQNEPAYVRSKFGESFALVPNTRFWGELSTHDYQCGVKVQAITPQATATTRSQMAIILQATENLFRKYIGR